MVAQSPWLFEAPLAHEAGELEVRTQRAGPGGFSAGATIPGRGRRPPLPRVQRGVGEIKRAGQGGEQSGRTQLGGRTAYPGRRVLITYEVDASTPGREVAHVRMMVLNEYGGGRWNYVGYVLVNDLAHLYPSNLTAFGTAVEARVRNLVLRKTGKAPSRVVKSGSANGPDVVWEYELLS